RGGLASLLRPRPDHFPARCQPPLRDRQSPGAREMTVVAGPARPARAAGGLTKALGAPLLLSVALLFLLPPWAGAAPAPIAKIDIEGVISPVTLRLVGIALDRAQAERAQALIIQLDTPGGLEKSMRATRSEDRRGGKDAR